MLALNRKQKKAALTVGHWLLNLPLLIIILLPLFYTLSISLMPAGDIYSNRLIPSEINLQNFYDALFKNPIPRFVLNSFIVSTAVMLGQMVTCSMAAFAFSFLRFRGRNLLFVLVLATMMVPGEATIIANFLTISRWGWNDSCCGRTISPLPRSCMKPPSWTDAPTSASCPPSSSP